MKPLNLWGRVMSPYAGEDSPPADVGQVAEGASTAVASPAAVPTELFAAAFDIAAEGMAIAGLDGTIRYANPALTALLHRSVTELTGFNVLDLTHPDDRGPSLTMTHRLLEEEFTWLRHDRRFLRPDGSFVPVQVSKGILRDPLGTPLGFVLIVADLSDRIARVEQLAREARHDALTGTANRTHLHEHLERVIASARATNRHVAALFCDLDNFREVNTSRGHAGGDQVLTQIAHRFKAAVRAHDLVARLGGDEFVIVCELQYPDEVNAIVDRVLAVFGAPVHLGDDAVPVTGSIGVAFAHRDGGAASLLARADQLMYAAKNNGRNQAIYGVPPVDVRPHVSRGGVAG